MSRSVRERPGVSRIVQERQGVSRNVQARPGVSRIIQERRGVIRNVQECPGASPGVSRSSASICLCKGRSDALRKVDACGLTCGERFYNEFANGLTCGDYYFEDVTSGSKLSHPTNAPSFTSSTSCDVTTPWMSC